MGKPPATHNFVGGSDRITYVVPVGEAAGPFTVTVELRYQFDRLPLGAEPAPPRHGRGGPLPGLLGRATRPPRPARQRHGGRIETEAEGKTKRPAASVEASEIRATRWGGRSNRLPRRFFLPLASCHLPLKAPHPAKSGYNGFIDWSTVEEIGSGQQLTEVRLLRRQDRALQRGQRQHRHPRHPLWHGGIWRPARVLECRKRRAVRLSPQGPLHPVDGVGQNAAHESALYAGRVGSDSDRPPAKEGLREDCYIRPLVYKATPTIGVRLHDLDDQLAIFAIPFGQYVKNEEGCTSPSPLVAADRRQRHPRSRQDRRRVRQFGHDGHGRQARRIRRRDRHQRRRPHRRGRRRQLLHHP